MERFDYFVSSVYTENCQTFLETMKEISDGYNLSVKDQMYQSDNFAYDIRAQEFANHVAQNAWDILNSQGYAMHRLETRLNELWLQVYSKYDYMPQHIHSGYSHISGFYFLDVPENSGRIIAIDPRAGKNQINLPERNREEVTHASDMVNFNPYPGLLLMTNSWLPHALVGHMTDERMKVLHFNITVKDYIPPPPPAEVI